MATWGTSTWNTGSWGTGADNNVIPTGISATFSIGSLSTSATVELGWGRDGWSQRSWGNPSQIVTPVVPENGMPMSLASVSVTGEINGGWGAFNWGDNAWGIAANLITAGNALTSNLGSSTVSAGSNATPSTNNGQTGTLTLNSPTILIAVEPPITGFGLTSNLGTADAGPDAMATGIGATMALGTVDAFNTTGWGRLQWNVNDWGDAGSSVIASTTGIAMTSALGSITNVAGDGVVVANTLNVAQATLGIVDPAPDTMITGNFMVGSLGTLGMQGDVTVSVTGIALTAAQGTAIGDLNQEVAVTGISMNNQLASVTVAINMDVIPTGFGLTANLNIANALIWNEVDTGSAPITPPGWREVAA